MFWINDPATHPRVDDLLFDPTGGRFAPHLVLDRWIDEADQFQLTLTSTTDPAAIPFDDLLYRWEFFPLPADRVILNGHRWQAHCLERLRAAESEAGTEGDRTPDQWEAWRAVKHWQEAIDSLWQFQAFDLLNQPKGGRLSTIRDGDGTHHIVPTRCLHVLSYRYPPTQAQEAA